MLAACGLLAKFRGSVGAHSMRLIPANVFSAAAVCSRKQRSIPDEAWHFPDFAKMTTSRDKQPEEQVKLMREHRDYAALKDVLDVFTNQQLMEVEKVDFMSSFETKYKGLAGLFWEKVQDHISKKIHLIMEEGLPPETFNLSGEEDLLDLLSINSASGMKTAANPGDVLRHYKELEDGKTYILVWGIMTQAKKLGL